MGCAFLCGRWCTITAIILAGVYHGLGWWSVTAPVTVLLLRDITLHLLQMRPNADALRDAPPGVGFVYAFGLLITEAALYGIALVINLGLA
jgi:hypothetical protein